MNRQQGLAMILGGRGDLAQIMGPDEELAHSVIAPVTLIACDPCASKPKCIERLPEYRAKANGED